MNQFNVGVLALRLVFGLFLAYHGYNKFFGPGGISGTVGWFDSIGLRWPAIQARVAALTEIGAGLLLAAGLITPFAAAGVIGVMIVAIVVAHWKVGFFIFKPNQGWEYCASIAVAAWAISAIGAGRYSLDHALGWFDSGSWTAPVIAGVLGIGGATLQLLVSYRPTAPSA